MLLLQLLIVNQNCDIIKYNCMGFLFNLIINNGLKNRHRISESCQNFNFASQTKS